MPLHHDVDRLRRIPHPLLGDQHTFTIPAFIPAVLVRQRDLRSEDIRGPHDREADGLLSRQIRRVDDLDQVRIRREHLVVGVLRETPLLREDARREIVGEDHRRLRIKNLRGRRRTEFRLRNIRGESAAGNDEESKQAKHGGECV